MITRFLVTNLNYASADALFPPLMKSGELMRVKVGLSELMRVKVGWRVLMRVNDGLSVFLHAEACHARCILLFGEAREIGEASCLAKRIDRCIAVVGRSVSESLLPISSLSNP